jgi:glycosyltransferase involved in cell wall biosynthesis
MPSGDAWPKISIVTPSYNQARFIEETIRSVLLQGYPNLEYIIIDGGSTDHSVEIIKRYEQWLSHWVSEQDRGQSDAINKGFNRASGQIYAWLNSDDYLLKNALRNVAMAYLGSPGAGGWFGGCLQVDESGDTLLIVCPNRLDAEALGGWGENAVTQPACFFSAKAWRECGPLDQDLHYAMDFDLWLKIAKHFTIEKVDDLLAAGLVHRDAKTQRDPAQMHAEHCVVQIRHGYEPLAIRNISQWISEYWRLLRKIDRISRFPFVRPFMPIVRIVWRRLR